MPTPIDKQVVLVTGCTTGGIGWHLCAALAAQGATVYASARRLAAMEGLKERGCKLVQLDVTNKESVAKAVDSIIKEAGRIDVLVNNAGVCMRKPTTDFTLDEVRYLFEVNYFGVVAMNEAVVPHMMARGAGKIFNVGSGLGFNAIPMMSHYAATKHALRAYSDMQRVELAPFGIKVVYVAPGYIKTHIADEDHHLPGTSIYNCFPKLATNMAKSVFMGVRFEDATPADVFSARMAKVVLSDSPPRHYLDGCLWWFPWLMSMNCPLWILDWSYAIKFGLFPGSMVGKPLPIFDKAK